MALKDIDTIVVVMLENRSFDHMLGYLALDPARRIEGVSTAPEWLQRHRNQFNGQDFMPHRLDPAAQRFDDPPHEQATIAMQIETPPFAGSPDRMGGFVQSYMTRKPQPTDASAVMGYYDAAAVPVFDFLARHYAVCDHWFAALPTGTQANRLMAMSGQSSLIDNAAVFLPDQPLVYDWLAEHTVNWCAYQAGDFLPFFSLMPRWLPEIVTSLSLSQFGARGRFRRYATFDAHWQSSEAMPAVIFIEPEYTDGPHAHPNDDHPPSGVANGQLLVADIYNTLIKNPARWANTLMLVTYDEHGGFFDHVPPLAISQPVAGFQFNTSGVRVPALVVSPQVAPGSVFDGALDHTSVLQLLADRFHPNQDYSASVGARQVKLDRLARVLVAPSAPVAAPAIPESVLAALRAQAAAPIVAAQTDSPTPSPNGQALNNAALKAARDHPDLVSMPGWQKLSDFVKQNRQP
jgi:phospholipase C